MNLVYFNHLALLGGLQGPELLFILVVILIFFGARKLPELAKGLGQGIKEFKKATKDVQQDLHQAMEDDDYHTPPPRKAPAPPPISEQAPSTEGSAPPVSGTDRADQDRVEDDSKSRAS